MQLRKTLLVGLVASVLLAGCSMEQDTVTMSPLPEVVNQFNPHVVWDKSVGNGVGQFYSHLSPTWQGSTVYAADRNGKIKAFEIDSGKELWSTDLSENIGFFSSRMPALLSGGLTVAGDRLYVGTEKAKIIALDATTGKVEWTSQVAGEALSRPVVSDGLVLVHTGNGMLQALNQNDGAIVWSVNLGTPALSVRGESAPAVAYGAAVVGSDNGRVSAVLLSQGQMIWQENISQATGTTEISRLNDVDMTPVISDNAIYAIAYNGNLVAMDMRTGQIIWKRDLGSVNDMAVAGDNIFVVDQNDHILSLRKSDGITIWSQNKLAHRNLTAPEIYNGYLVAGDGEGYLHWLNMADGKFMAQNKVNSSGLLSRPVVAGDKLMVQAKDGTVYLYTR
ncbi:MAG: outer membrane protein assembly factor BamB [Enterobacteriaceae bacterium]|jgi:outer membrane protein assembly factor BamB|nr:outer membrane protein assembly factor BamB [Enterobacteriaceae bacterium]